MNEVAFFFEFDAQTEVSMSELLADDDLPQLLVLATNAVIHLSGYADRHPEKPFLLNADALPWVEKYLRERVRPMVVKWSHKSEPLVVRSLKGNKTRTPAALNEVHAWLRMAGLVYGQCLANELNLKWCYEECDNRLPALKGDKRYGTHFPWWKPAKFAHLGKEDSLVQALQAYKRFPLNSELMKLCDNQFIAAGFEQHDAVRSQNWHDTNGLLETRLYFDDNGATLFEVHVPAERRVAH